MIGVGQRKGKGGNDVIISNNNENIKKKSAPHYSRGGDHGWDMSDTTRQLQDFSRGRALSWCMVELTSVLWSKTESCLWNPGYA